MSYDDFERLGGKYDVPLRGTVTRRWALENGACPDCGERLPTASLRCTACGLDHIIPSFPQQSVTPDDESR
jgi:hypothetical protein